MPAVRPRIGVIEVGLKGCGDVSWLDLGVRRPWAVVMVMVDEVRPWLEHGSSDSLFYGGGVSGFEDEGRGGC
ncbi:hypothetical protein M0R45_016052 [Rubus argutus]|uniref:Uncharacterized protein n=1 Tax=Rubus argutus TaxID=59490 RepID=A0AAW1XTD1_RUBAR